MSLEHLIVTSGGNTLNLCKDIKCQYDTVDCTLDLIFFFPELYEEFIMMGFS